VEVLVAEAGVKPRSESRSTASRTSIHWRMVYAASSWAYCIFRSSMTSVVMLYEVRRVRGDTVRCSERERRARRDYRSARPRYSFLFFRMKLFRTGKRRRRSYHRWGSPRAINLISLSRSFSSFPGSTAGNDVCVWVPQRRT